MDIRRSAVIAAPAESVWAMLRDFNGHTAWHPAVASSALEDGAIGDQVGAVRAFRLREGGRVREQLLAHNDCEMRFSYCILEAPVPLRGYVAHMRLRPVTDSDACFVEWRCTFDPPAAERAFLSRFVAEDIYEAGLRGLRAAMSGGAPLPVPAPTTTTSGGAEAVAVVLSGYGGVDMLRFQRVRAPDPGPGEARIRQSAIGVNFIDVYCRRGSFTLVPPGGVPGMEAAGVVESVGPGVANVRPGDRVGYACAPPGAYASLRTMRADLLVKLPDGISDIDAAALLLKGITASFLLHDVHALRPGELALVHAAAGGVGQILCRWAKALGASVIGTVSTEAKVEQARRAGCDHVLIHGPEDFADTALRLSGGRGMDVIYDAIGRDTYESSLRALAARGHLVSFGQASGDVGLQSIDRLAARSVTLSRPNYVHYTDTTERLRQQTDRLFAALAAGHVVAEPPRRYALADVARAHADLEGRRTTGALVLIP